MQTNINNQLKRSLQHDQHVTTAQWKCMRLRHEESPHAHLALLTEVAANWLKASVSMSQQSSSRRSLSDVLIGQLRVYIFSSPSVKVKETSVDDNILRILSPSQVLTEIYWNAFTSCSRHKPKIAGLINVSKGLSSFHPVNFVQGQLHQSAYLIFVHFWTPASGRNVQLCWVPLLLAR